MQNICKERTDAIAVKGSIPMFGGGKYYVTFTGNRITQMITPVIQGSMSYALTTKPPSFNVYKAFAT
jgi:hypothetical protein